MQPGSLDDRIRANRIREARRDHTIRDARDAAAVAFRDNFDACVDIAVPKNYADRMQKLAAIKRLAAIANDDTPF